MHALTGVAEGDVKTEKEIRKLVREEPAPSDAKFAEKMTKDRKTPNDRGATKITVRMLTGWLRASNKGGAWSIQVEELPHRDGRGSCRRNWMAARMDTNAGAGRHHNQRGRSVGARIAGTTSQTLRKDKADTMRDRTIAG